MSERRLAAWRKLSPAQQQACVRLAQKPLDRVFGPDQPGGWGVAYGTMFVREHTAASLIRLLVCQIIDKQLHITDFGRKLIPEQAILPL